MYNKRNKKWNVKQMVIICSLIILIIIGIVINVVTTDRNLTVFEKAIKDSVFFVGKVVSYPVDFIIEKSNAYKEKNQMYEKYKDMQIQLMELERIKNENIELKWQLEHLKDTLDLNHLITEYSIINATVVSRDLNYWNDTLIIDKGENKAIKIGDPVIVNHGLIGKVIKTTNFTSTVRLITANNINDKISVKISENENTVFGILTSYNKKKNTYIIEGIAQNIDIANGTLVTTTGMGDTFPSGIVIGKVIGIDTDNFDLAKVLEVESLVDFNNINYVSILKRSDQP